MIGAAASRCIYFAAAVLFALAFSMFVADAAHAHTEPVIDVPVHSDDGGSNANAADDWIPGHCHGGPSCTGALFLAEVVRPHGIVRLSRTKYFVVRVHFAGQFPSRDPPIPIVLL